MSLSSHTRCRSLWYLGGSGFIPIFWGGLIKVTLQRRVRVYFFTVRTNVCLPPDWRKYVLVSADCHVPVCPDLWSIVEFMFVILSYSCCFSHVLLTGWFFWTLYLRNVILVTVFFCWIEIFVWFTSLNPARPAAEAEFQKVQQWCSGVSEHNVNLSN